MRTLLIILLSLVVLNVITRLFLKFWGPKLLQWYIRRKMNMHGDNPFGNKQPDFTVPADKKKEDRNDKGDEGEYIDFEEIK